MAGADRAAEAARTLQSGAGVHVLGLLPGLFVLLPALCAHAATASDTFIVRATVIARCAVPAKLLSTPDRTPLLPIAPCVADAFRRPVSPPHPIVRMEHDDETGGMRMVLEF